MTPNKNIRRPKLFDENAVSFTVADYTAMASEMLKAAKSIDDRVSVDSGNFTNSFMNHSIYNSNGVRHNEKITSFFWSILGMAIDGNDVSNFDIQSDGCHMLADVKVSASGETLARNTLRIPRCKEDRELQGRNDTEP